LASASIPTSIPSGPNLSFKISAGGSACPEPCGETTLEESPLWLRITRRHQILIVASTRHLLRRSEADKPFSRSSGLEVGAGRARRERLSVCKEHAPEHLRHAELLALCELNKWQTHVENQRWEEYLKSAFSKKFWDKIHGQDQ
jgi:hypothetical protein